MIRGIRRLLFGKLIGDKITNLEYELKVKDRMYESLYNDFIAYQRHNRVLKKCVEDWKGKSIEWYRDRE